MKKKLLPWVLMLALCFAGAQTAEAAEGSDTQVYKTKSLKEFFDAGSELVSQYEPMMVKSRNQKGAFQSARLIVKADGNFPAGSYGARKVVESPDHIYLMQYDNSRQAERALARIQGSAGVEYAEADEYVECAAVDEDMTAQGVSWGSSAIGADKYAEYVAAVTSRKIKVAVVDTGVSSHPQLSKRLVKGRNFINRSSNTSDPSGHGTHVAGIIADCTPGLKVKIMPIRVINTLGNGYTSVIGMGIQYAVKHGAKVINMSLGGEHSRYIDERVSQAVKKGAVVVAAAGNENQNTSRLCPAHMKKAIVVGAVDQYNQRALFSNYGKALDVMAPGVGIVSAVPGGYYKSDSGTSMAAPHITAVAAMYKLVYPKKNPAAIEKMVKKHVKDLGARGWDKYYGKGIPNLAPLAVPVKITLDKKTMTMEKGQKLTLKVSFTPSTAYKKTLKWKSSNKAVAAVDSKGVVTGKTTGTAVITASSYNGKKAVCKVTVTEASSVQPEESVSVKTGQQFYSCRIGEPLAVDIVLNLKETIQQNAFQHILYCGYLDEKQLVWRGLGSYDIDGSTYLRPRWENTPKAANLRVNGRQARLRLIFDTSGMEPGEKLFRASIFPYAGFPSGESLSDCPFIVDFQP